MNEQKRLNDRYQLEELLGSGGMAFVYRGTDLMLERPVAVKILRQNFTETEEFRERFRLEARAAANLSHPNIVTIYDFGISDEHPFIVMEYIPGPHLKRRIQQLGRIPIPECIDLMSQACAGIGYAHRAGIVHCDIKPHNLVVSPDGQLKVTDFGIARALASIHPDEQTDIVWGSPQYFAPEQAAGSPPSPASDVYSLGVVMYEMLTGTLPFQADSSEELAHLHQISNPVPPSQLNPAISIELEKILLKVLEKEPAARYRTADQLGHILETLEQPAAAMTAPKTAAIRPVEILPAAQPQDWSNQQPASPPTRAYTSQPSPTRGPTQPGIDWVVIFLGLLAAIAVGGLIPFWLWIVLLFNNVP
jgi:serine/threonine-protein kinase